MLISGIGSTSLYAHALDRQRTFLKPGEKPAGQQTCDPWIELNLENMTWNLSQIRKAAKVPVMAVIKANGYGHGLVEIGRHLEEAGIDHLMVGKLQEALLLREKGVSTPILNFGPFSSGDAKIICLLYTSPSPRDRQKSRMPSSA